jgi:hypothetical protein
VGTRRNEAAHVADPWVNPALALPLLQRVESLDGQATGTLTLGTEQQPQAVVFVQRGRICWAVSERMRDRLTDLLVANGGHTVERKVIEQVYQRCREQCRPLGEALVAEQIVTAEGLRTAMLQHTTEALLSVERNVSASWSWGAHAKPSYDAAHTFLPAELWVSLSAVQRPDEALLAVQTLDRASPSAGAGLAFLREFGATPIVARGVELSLSDLRDTGQWLAGVLDVSDAISPQSMAVLNTASREALVVWQSHGIGYIVACADPSEVTYVIAARRG